MKKTIKIIYFIINLFFFTKIHSQQQTKINVVLNDNSQILNVNQTINFTNTSSNSITKLVLNDWNNAYSSKESHLAKRFSDEFTRNFHVATESERGITKISKIIVNNNNIAIWNRVENQIDLIEIELIKDLKPNESVFLELTYSLKIPDSKFTRFGYSNGKYNLKNCFINVARLNNDGLFTYYSNENLEDIAASDYQKINLTFDIPKNLEVVANCNFISQLENNTSKIIQFESENKTEIQFDIEKKYSYESFKNEQVEVVTNLYEAKINGIQKSLIIDKVVNYISKNLGKFPEKKIMVSQVDYERNPFYGLNQLPAFMSPFPNDFLYELKFLKAYLHNYLKATLKIDYRKNGYIFDAIQVYYLMKYVEENYPDLKMQGNIAKYKITKGYNLINANFNNQYKYLYLLMARDNLDQNIGESKESFIKFNEQIAGKYKAGLSFKYLNSFLQKNEVENSFRSFLELNREKQTNSDDFEAILKKNASQNIDWFFPNLIQTRKIIDYKFGKIFKGKDEVLVTIKNNSNTTVPITLTGLKNKEIVFSQWINNIKTDTTFSIKKNIADKLILNYNSDIPEYNARNNYKSLKGIFRLNRPLKFNFFKDLENPAYNQVFYIPEIGYNLYDGIIASLSFHNKSFINRTFIYDVSPSLSLKTKTLSGSGSFFFRQQFREKKLFEIRYGISSSFYQYVQNASYLKINPVVQFKFRDSDLRSNKRQYLTFRNVIVNKEEIPANTIVSTSLRESPLNYSIYNVKYIYQNSEFTKGFGFGTDVQFASNFGKIATEFSYRKLLDNNYEFSLRCYAGTFLYKKTDSEFYNFGLDRPKDYLFDYSFLGRSETSGIFSQEFVTAEGGFKSKFSNPYANKWMTTLNATSSIYHWIEMYGDVGLYQNKGDNTKFVFDSGLHLDLVPGYFELFLPVYSTNGFEMGQKNYQEKIRFIITLNPKSLLGLFTRKWF